MWDNGELTNKQAETEMDKWEESVSQKFDNGELTDKQAEMKLNKLVERKDKDKETIMDMVDNGNGKHDNGNGNHDNGKHDNGKHDTTTAKEAKKAKEVLNELIKCNAIELIQDKAFTSEQEAPNEPEGHNNNLPICPEERYRAYGEEGGINSEIEEECNYDLETLFKEEDEIEEGNNLDPGTILEKEDEIRRLKNDVKRFRQSLNTLLRSQENCSHVQHEFKTCDHHEYDVEVHVTQPTNEGNSLEEKFPVNTTYLDTRESQIIPVSATYGTRAPVESKLTHPVPAGQLQQPVPHTSQALTHQVNLRIFSIVSILSVLFVALVWPM